MFRYGYAHKYGRDACCSCSPTWTIPLSKEEFIEDVEDYKVQLEAEIAALEKKIKALKERTE